MHARRLALIAPLSGHVTRAHEWDEERQTLPPRRFRTCVRRHVNAQLSLFLTPFIQEGKTKKTRVGETTVVSGRDPETAQDEEILCSGGGSREEHSRCTRKYSLARESACTSTGKGGRGRTITSETLSRLKKGRER